MANENSSKVRLLMIWEILRNESDEETQLSLQDIIFKLGEKNIEAERKSVSRDIAMLIENGYEILINHGKRNQYFVVDRSFDIPEVKIMLDAVQSAHFVTEKKTAELVVKIAALAGKSASAVLTKNVTQFGTTKHTNEKIYYNVDTLLDGVVLKKKVSFLYFEYGPDGKKIVRRGGARYVVNPVGLVYSEDNYYLTCYDDKHLSLCNYRVDRMEKVQVEEENLTPSDAIAQFDEQAHRKEVFSMYLGKKQTVTLVAENELANALVDKFGENVVMQKTDAGHFTVTADVQISPTFFAWCFTFGDKLKLAAPTEVVAEYSDMLKKALQVQI